MRRILDRLVVAWCRALRTHYSWPWVEGDDGTWESEHHGCVTCTWCVECGRLLGRTEVVDGHG